MRGRVQGWLGVEDQYTPANEGCPPLNLASVAVEHVRGPSRSRILPSLSAKNVNFQD